MKVKVKIKNKETEVDVNFWSFFKMFFASYIVLLVIFFAIGAIFGLALI